MGNLEQKTRHVLLGHTIQFVGFIARQRSYLLFVVTLKPFLFPVCSLIKPKVETGFKLHLLIVKWLQTGSSYLFDINTRCATLAALKDGRN